MRLIDKINCWKHDKIDKIDKINRRPNESSKLLIRIIDEIIDDQNN